MDPLDFEGVSMPSGVEMPNLTFGPGNGVSERQIFGGDINGAGADSDPFAYTNGSLLTPWTRTFQYNGPQAPAGGYYSGSGGYSPLAPFEYADFNYNFTQPGRFEQTGEMAMPQEFKYAAFQNPAAFVSPEDGQFTLDRYRAPSPFVMGDIKDDPSYQFRLKQGLDALENSAAAKGMLRTGNTWQALENYGQQAASQEYAAAYGRKFGEYQLAANLGLSEFDRNQAAKVTESETRYNRAASEYDRNVSNALNAYKTNYGVASDVFKTNFQNQFNVQQANFTNALNAWRGNADVSLQGQNLGYQIASGAWDRNYGKALSSYQTQVQQAEAAAQIAASEAAAAAASAQWADSTNYNRALQGYNMEYEQFQNNQANQFSRLYSLAGLGLNAAGSMANAGTGYGNTMGNIAMGIGNSQAAGTVGSANAWGSALGNIGNLGTMLAAYAMAPKTLTSVTGAKP